MTYKEYEDNIKKKFIDCVNTTDEKLRFKIIQSLENWYQENYAKDVKEAFEKKDEVALISIVSDIDNVCSKPDYVKVKLTYNDESYNLLKKISQDIFSLVKESINKNNYSMTKDQYDKCLNDLKICKQNVSSLFKDDFDYLYSESILDLDYLLNKGNVKELSFRTSHYLEENGF